MYTAYRVLLFNLSVEPEDPSLHLQHSAIDNAGDGRGGGGSGRINFSVPKGPDGRGRRGLEWVRYYTCFPNSFLSLWNRSVLRSNKTTSPLYCSGRRYLAGFQRGMQSGSSRHLDASLRIMEIDTRRTLSNYAPIFRPCHNFNHVSVVATERCRKRQRRRSRERPIREGLLFNFMIV